MTTRLVAALVTGTFALTPLAASAEPLPPACVVVNATPVTVQAGYAPTGPDGCVVLA